MNLLIFSDSHGKPVRMQEGYVRQCVLAEEERPDAVLFLGDGLSDLPETSFWGKLPIYAVRGNCDGVFGDTRALLTPVLGGKSFFLTHGNQYGVRTSFSPLADVAVQSGADVALFGHTHTPYLETLPAGSEINGRKIKKPLILFNPGSIAEGSFGCAAIHGDSILFSFGKLL